MINKLNIIKNEMRDAFLSWDEKISNGQQPIPIQDLEYWLGGIKNIIDELEQNKR